MIGLFLAFACMITSQSSAAIPLGASTTASIERRSSMRSTRDMAQRSPTTSPLFCSNSVQPIPIRTVPLVLASLDDDLCDSRFSNKSNCQCDLVSLAPTSQNISMPPWDCAEAGSIVLFWSRSESRDASEAHGCWLWDVRDRAQSRIIRSCLSGTSQPGVRCPCKIIHAYGIRVCAFACAPPGKRCTAVQQSGNLTATPQGHRFGRPLR